MGMYGLSVVRASASRGLSNHFPYDKHDPTLMRTKPLVNSMSGRIRAFIASAGRPVTTREVGDEFGMGGAAASAFLCQLRSRGELRNDRRVYAHGHYSHQSTWLPV